MLGFVVTFCKPASCDYIYLAVVSENETQAIAYAKEEAGEKYEQRLKEIVFSKGVN